MNDSGAGPPELNPVLASCTLKEIEDFFVRCDGTLVTGFGYAQTTIKMYTIPSNQFRHHQRLE